MVAPHDQPSAPVVPPLPVPDPTKVTTEAIERLEKQLKELFGTQFAALNTRFDRMQEQFDSRPAAVVAEIAHLRQLTEEKFKGVDQQFAGRDTALAAALLAQKTSVEEQNKANAASAGKSEAGFTKQIDGALTLITATAKAGDDKIDGVKALLATQSKTNDEKINDLRDRLTTIDGREEGGSATVGIILAAIAAISSIIAIIAAVAAVLK